MTYLITEIVVYLVAAAVWGLVVGYWLFGRRYKAMYLAKERELGRAVSSKAEVEAELESAVAHGADVEERLTELEARVAADDDPSLLSEYPVEEIQGIGKAFGARLRGMGIDTTSAFADKCRAESGRQTVAQLLDIEEGWVFRMHCMAGLMQVPGIRGQDAELLEASGVATLEDLVAADPHELSSRMADVNDRQHLTPDAPNPDRLSVWAANARDLTAPA